MDDLSNMKMFARVAEQGSFSAAARTLGLTPSAVSRQVSQLENELGARLFQRTTRKQSLTEAGEIYVQHARRIIADVDEARLAVNRLTDMPAGSLHVTAEADFAMAFVAPILPTFLDQYPAVQLHLTMGTSMMDLVDGGIDLAIRIGHLDDSSLIARKIASSRSVLCTSPAYLERHRIPLHPGELVSHNCLSFRTEPGRNHWTFKVSSDVLDVPISGRLNVNSLMFLREAALAGLGIIMIPKWMVNDALGARQLVPVLENFALDPPNTPVHAVFAHNRHLAPKVRAFVEFLTDRMGLL